MRCMACKEDWSFVSPSYSWTKLGTLPRTKGVKLVIKDIFFVYSYFGVLWRIPKFLPFTHTVFYGLASTTLALPLYDGEFISTYFQIPSTTVSIILRHLPVKKIIRCHHFWVSTTFIKGTCSTDLLNDRLVYNQPSAVVYKLFPAQKFLFRNVQLV